MSRFGEVGVALLNPLGGNAGAKGSATTVTSPVTRTFGVGAGGINPSPFGKGAAFKPPAPKPKPAIQPPAPKPPAIQPPVVSVLPKPPVSPPTVTPPLALPVTAVVPGGGSFLNVPASGGGGAAAPVATGADSPAVTPASGGLLSNPWALGALAIGAYLLLSKRGR